MPSYRLIEPDFEYQDEGNGTNISEHSHTQFDVLRFVSMDFCYTWLIAFVITLLTSLTIGGNLVAALTFCSVKELRKVSNSFIISLCLADLCSGCLMPISMATILMARWPFGHTFCTIYQTLKYFLSDTSMFSILLITIDRWWSIHKPFHYRIKQSASRACAIIVVAWCLGFLIYGPLILGWEVISDDISVNQSRFCHLPFRKKFVYVFSTALLEFIFPFLVLIICNTSIYLKISKRKDKDIRRSVSTSDYYSVSQKSSSEEDALIQSELNLQFRLHNGSLKRELSRSQIVVTLPRGTTPPPRRHSAAPSAGETCCTINGYRRCSSTPLRRVSFDSTVVMSSLLVNRRFSRHSTQRRQSNEIVREMLIRQDRKAAVALAMLVSAFTLCWAPYSVVKILYCFYPNCLPYWSVQLSEWLVWVNAAVNPFLYAAGNSKFRRRVRKYFGCVSSPQVDYIIGTQRLLNLSKQFRESCIREDDEV